MVHKYDAGWFGAADIQRAYGKEAQGGDVKAAAKKAAIVWATGIPVSLNISCESWVLLVRAIVCCHNGAVYTYACEMGADDMLYKLKIYAEMG